MISVKRKKLQISKGKRTNQTCCDTFVTPTSMSCYWIACYCNISGNLKSVQLVVISYCLTHKSNIHHRNIKLRPYPLWFGSGRSNYLSIYIKSSKNSRFLVVNSNYKWNTLGDEGLRLKADHGAPYRPGEHDRWTMLKMTLKKKWFQATYSFEYFNLNALNVALCSGFNWSLKYRFWKSLIQRDMRS